MTEALPELQGLPKGLALDGELVAVNAAGDPHFPLLSERILNRDTSVPI
jgi:ATP-dependent DNA ligase